MLVIIPLDAHAQLGNNVMLAKQLGLTIIGRAGYKDMLLLAELNQPQTLKTHVESIARKLQRTQ